MAERVFSGSARRARQMLLGGLVAAHCTLVPLAAICWWALGKPGIASAILGFGVVVLFFSVGQAIEVVACEMEPVAGMVVALASYAARVAGITAGLWWIFATEWIHSQIHEKALVIAVTVGVVSWITGVVFVASRQRVPIYDVEYQPPEYETSENFR